MNEILSKLGFVSGAQNIHCNLSATELIERSIAAGEGNFSEDGALVVYTGEKTGRSANDKYVVMSDYTQASIDWTNNVHKMKSEDYHNLRKHVLEDMKSLPLKDLYLMGRSVGAMEGYNLNVNLLTTSASHALFSHHMFREDEGLQTTLGSFTVIHAPNLKLKASDYNLQSSTVIAINIDEREIVIAGTKYAGEIKKAIFSIMNFLLPELEVFPMHTGCNVGKTGDVSLFFGLSGTGKTTLSTDDGRKLVGDDEHGLCPQGTFNFEGGCYAKTYKLSEDSEPGIFHACSRFGTMIENVTMDVATRTVDFDDKTITENGRASYPLSYIPDVELSGKAGVPNHIFFLSADAFGVLPAVAKLTPEQSMYYFLSGYTAKLAGTELGVKEPSATFSHCFGAPFMMRTPMTYANLLKRYVEKYNINVWLINTGWTGGGYGVGNRFPIKTTRQIIRSIQANKVNTVATKRDEIFGLHTPTAIEGVNNEYLFPWLSWKSKEDFDTNAKKLAQMFHKNFAKFGDAAGPIKAGAPLFQ